MSSIVTSIPELRSALATERLAGRTIALVPTMGALHDGHLALVDRARQLAEVVVVSIFVNPMQFGPDEDLERYPRTLSADVGRLGDVLVFAPSVEEMYPAGASQTRVAAGPVASRFEGESRPGHFDGMLTVVAKLVNIVQPDTVVFGQKDAQQVFLVTRMVAELNFPPKVEVVPTVREADGLALSSRNQFLSADEKRAALALSRALGAAAASANRGADAARAAARDAAVAEPLVDLDYFEIVDPADFLPVPDDFHGSATAIIAARVGTTRLIDNRNIRLRSG